VRIASRYLLVQYLAAVAMLLAGITVTWVAADTLFHIDELSKHPIAALRDVGLRAVDVLPLGVPRAGVAGAVGSLTRSVRYREVTAIRAGGIPLQAALVPLLATTFVISGLLLLIEDRVVVPARARLESGSDDPASGPSRSPVLQNGRWWYAGGRSVLTATSYDLAERRLTDVTVFDLDDERRIRRRVEADEAVYVGDDVWRLADARLFEMPREGSMSITRAPTLELDLELNERDLKRALLSVGATSLNRLARRIRESRDDAGRPALEAALHGRIAQPMAALVLVLFAIRFAIGDVERGDSLARSLLLAFGVTGLYWLCWTVALLTARSGVVPAALPIWGTLAIALVLGLGRFRAIPE
jgi:lipopolysaccharide export LptBFGC system permease protein LptF